MAKSQSEQSLKLKSFSHDSDSKSVKIITRRPNGTIRVSTENNDQSLTDPQWEKEADINNIMEKFQKHGVITHRSKQQGVYADVSSLPDLLGASIIVKQAQDNFDALPSYVREKFKNDPQNMIDFLSDPKNNEQAVELGLMTKKVAPKNDELNDENKAPQKQSKAKTAQTPEPE